MRFDFDGCVKIDIVNPSTMHCAYLEEELPFLVDRPRLEDHHDVRMMFRDDLRMDARSAVRVEAPVGYDSEGVFWFDPKQEMARIDFRDFDGGTTPLLISNEFNAHFLYILVLYLLSFKAMRHGGVFCHAAAVHYRGKTILFPAWRHVGKTNLLLSLLEEGAELISDDGVILFEDGEVLAYSKRLHLLYFNFASYPRLMDQADPGMKALIQFVENVRAGVYGLSKANSESLQKLIRVRLPGSAVAGRLSPGRSYRCDLVMHLNKCMGPAGATESLAPISLDALATKCAESTAFELSHFLSAYRVAVLTQGVRDPLLDRAEARIRDLLRAGFSHCGAWHEVSFNQRLDAGRARDVLNRCMDDA